MIDPDAQAKKGGVDEALSLLHVPLPELVQTAPQLWAARRSSEGRSPSCCQGVHAR